MEKRNQMKKNKVIFIIVLFMIISCKVFKKDYIIIHSNNKDDVKTQHYFHGDNTEFARVYGNSTESDSIVFLKKDNDLLVNEFIYRQESKKRILRGNIRYINYYTSVTDIKYSTNAIYIDVNPIEDLDFLKNDKEIKKNIIENCSQNKVNNSEQFYSNCDFRFSQSNILDYLPVHSLISSVKIKEDKNQKLKDIDIEASYFDRKFNYKRLYYYKDKRILKIETFVKDSISTSYFLDTFSKEDIK